MDDPTTDNVTEGFGLMFYNARWYDPGLGRFAQADTIVPGGVQGLDRYAYVNNSPLMYIDPSGHTALCGVACEEEEKWVSPLLSGVKGGKTGVSGADLYRLYLDLYQDKDAWYWEDGDFTIWDFITLIYYQEASTLMTAEDADSVAFFKDYQEGWSRSFHTWCRANPGTCRGADDPYSVLNFLSKYSQSAGSLTEDSAKKPLLDRNDNIVPLSSASVMVAGLHNSAWSGGCYANMNAPCYVGNESLYVSGARGKAFAANRWVYDSWGSGNSVVILTACQSIYWNGGYKDENGKARYYWSKGGKSAFRRTHSGCQIP